jgi:bifunctional ADP-heptose synthase (sugar kinase/adenylyltransferase)
MDNCDPKSEACHAVTLDNPKLFSLPEAVALRGRLRAAGQRVVLTNGIFDLLHTGHLYYLKKPGPRRRSPDRAECGCQHSVAQGPGPARAG